MPDAPRRANRPPRDRRTSGAMSVRTTTPWRSEEPSGGARRRASCPSRDGRGPPRASRGAARSQDRARSSSAPIRAARDSGRHADLQPDPARRPQPVRHRLAMEEVAVPGGRLERVTERVAKVQRDPPTGSIPSRARRRRRPRPWPSRPVRRPRRPRPTRTRPASPRRDRRPVRLEKLEQALVAECRHLDRLAEGGPELALGERLKQRDVDDHRDRLMERAEEVLPLGQVDAGLAADRRIDLGDERGRNLDERHAAQVRRREEPGRVAQRAASDRHQWLGPFDTQRSELAGRVLDHREPLGLFALRQEHRFDRPARARGDRPRSARPRQSTRPARVTRIARRARRVVSSAARASAAMPSPRTMRPIGVEARRRTVPPRSAATAVPAAGAPAPPLPNEDRRAAPRPRRRPRGPRRLRSGGSAPPRRTARACGRVRGPSRSDRAPATSGRTCGDRRSRWARTSGRPSSQTVARPRYSAHRLRGSTTAPPPVAMIR